MSYFCGIDPGITGAVAILDKNLRIVIVEDLPVSNKRGKVKRELCAVELHKLLIFYRDQIALCAIERVAAMPKQGVASMFSLGHSAGVIDGVIGALQLPHIIVSASAWKFDLNLPAEKDVVLAGARRRWPEAPLRLEKHHNRAEAIRLAEWAAMQASR